MARTGLELGGAQVERSSGERKRLLLNLAAAALAGLWLILLSTTLTPRYDDFKQYWQAAVNLQATGDPYTPAPGREATAHAGFYYPPSFAYLTQPLALVDQLTGQYLWFWLNVAATLGFALLCIQLSGAAFARRYWGLVLLLFLLTPPVRLNLQLGQISAMMSLLILGTFALAARRPALSGLLLALAVTTRIFPALLGLPLLLRGHWRAIGWCGAWVAGLLFGSLAAYGVGPFQSFLLVARNPSVPYPFAAEHNISFFGFFSRILAPGPYTAAPIAELPWLVAPLTALCGATVLALCLWRGRTADGSEAGLSGLGLWLCVMMLLSSTNGTYTLMLLLAPLLALVRFLEREPNRPMLLALIGCTLLTLVPPRWSAFAPGLDRFTHTGWGLLLLTPALYGLVGYVIVLAWVAGRQQRGDAGSAGGDQ